MGLSWACFLLLTAFVTASTCPPSDPASSKMPRKTVVAVVGPDAGAENLVTMAEELGRAIASHGYVLLTGGRSRGVMDAACKGAQVGAPTITTSPNNTIPNDCRMGVHVHARMCATPPKHTAYAHMHTQTCPAATQQLPSSCPIALFQQQLHPLSA
jgi:hypothetical protein